MSIESLTTEKQRGKKDLKNGNKKMEENISELRDNYRRCSPGITGVPERKERTI